MDAFTVASFSMKSICGITNCRMRIRILQTFFSTFSDRFLPSCDIEIRPTIAERIHSIVQASLNTGAIKNDINPFALGEGPAPVANFFVNRIENLIGDFLILFSSRNCRLGDVYFPCPSRTKQENHSNADWPSTKNQNRLIAKISDSRRVGRVACHGQWLYKGCVFQRNRFRQDMTHPRLDRDQFRESSSTARESSKSLLLTDVCG